MLLLTINQDVNDEEEAPNEMEAAPNVNIPFDDCNNNNNNEDAINESGVKISAQEKRIMDEILFLQIADVCLSLNYLLLILFVND